MCDMCPRAPDTNLLLVKSVCRNGDYYGKSPNNTGMHRMW